MAASSARLALPGSSAAQAVQEPWIVSRNWDLTWLIGSALLIPVPLLLHYGVGLSSGVIDVLVAMLIGGPHMYATYTLSYLEPRFLRRYRAYAAGAVVIPVFVFYLALTDLTLLITGFMFWASIHVMHQVAFLSDCYRRRYGEAWVSLSRAVDYAVLFTSLYPFGFQRLIRGEFVVGQRTLLVPDWARSDWLASLAMAAFLVAFGLYVAKSVVEYRDGRLSVPKTALITVTVVTAFGLPLIENLDVAFEGMNVWHSLQYFAFIWYLNRTRFERGQIGNGLVRRTASSPSGLRLYGLCAGTTLLAGLSVILLQVVGGLSREQAYFGVVLSSLLVHYYVDHFLFTRADEGIGVAPLWGVA